MVYQGVMADDFVPDSWDENEEKTVANKLSSLSFNPNAAVFVPGQNVHASTFVPSFNTNATPIPQATPKTGR